LIRN
jgi:hypothetical protein